MPDRARQLYDAAVALFLERGYRDVDVDDIVAECGVSRGTFYGSFRNKRDLLDAIMIRCLDDLGAAVFDGRDWSALADRGAFVDEFHALVRRALQHAFDHAELLSFVILAAPGVDADALKAMLGGYRQLSAQVTDILSVAAERGWLRSDVPINTVWAGQLVVSTLTQAASPVLLGSGEPFDVDEITTFVANYLLGGLPAVLSTG
ncbi:MULTISPECIES: TetR/AcrR family transcriptional regulator [Mycolicibacterium]|uniref:TetR/AcrR family transcriptional regulator n=1 Tax=Mycolicibacterium TaxID=1866885 RepID=UPI001F4D2681|nr:TetR/AcrR family transcriptional regulator [Mycolicibacterium neoaurum]